MDFLRELEAMASTASSVREVEAVDLQRWQELFGFTEAQSRAELEAYPDDITGQRVTDEHWESIREVQEAAGFDVEAYSYFLATQGRVPVVRKGVAGGRDEKGNGNSKARYTFKLEEPVSTPEELQRVAGLSGVPKVLKGESDGEETCQFCIITSVQKDQLLRWLGRDHLTFTPTLVRITQSIEELGEHTIAPFLGRETSLPHQRPTDAGFHPLPQQDQYPVWYFFYGRLLEPELLQRQLNLTSPPTYRSARVRGASMRSWQGQYRAVVDGQEDDVVDGAAFWLESVEHEDTLRFLETDAYEVVRCAIKMVDGGGEGGEEPGLMFRFCGPEDALT